MSETAALEITRSLMPLYRIDAAPDKLWAAAVDRLAAVLGASVQLQLPDVLGGGTFGPVLEGEHWETGIDHEGRRVRLVLSGEAPDEATRAALRLELERLVGHLAHVRRVNASLDRLEFRLEALHQISRTLTIARELPATEAHIVDFTGELFFAWHTALYRPRDPGTLEPRQVRALSKANRLPLIYAADLAELLPIGKESRAILMTGTPEPPAWLPAGVEALATLDVAGGRLGCLMLGERMTGEPYREDDIQLLSTVAHSCAIALKNAELVAELRQKAILDELTGLFNRRFFDKRLGEELARADRYRRPVTLILLDVDEFKTYNDTYGHAAGDVLLSRIGAVIRANTRSVDQACRYGGEEFAVIAPETDQDQALVVARRLREAVGGLQAVTGVQRRMTVSAGVAAYPDHARDASGLLEAADRALYRAKAAGRDRVACATLAGD